MFRECVRGRLEGKRTEVGDCHNRSNTSRLSESSVFAGGVVELYICHNNSDPAPTDS